MNDLNFNIFNVIILTGIIHGFIFCLIILISKKLNSKTNYFLAFTILCLVFSNLQYWLIDINIHSGYENNNLIFIPFEFLMLPFFFLFVKSYINKESSKKEKVFLFLPFFLIVIYQIFGDALFINFKIINILNLIIEYISIVFSITIIFLVLKSLTIYEKTHAKYSISKISIKTKWLKQTLYIGLLLCALWFISLNLFDSYFKSGYYQFYPLWIGMTGLIYWIGYIAILQNHLFNERKEIRKKKEKLSNTKVNLSTYSKIDSLIIKNKLHLNPLLSLKKLSKELNLSESYISHVINKNSNLNFNDHINSLRVHDAKTMLINPDYKNYTITAIGLEAGFNSKSSFYSAFKKFTGKTPVEYKKSVRNI